MVVQFLGTRGEITLRTALHHMHSALLLRCHRRRVLVDCGTDWTGLLDQLRPDVIFLTHSHPDHADALQYGAPCPVYATEATWRVLKKYPVASRRIVQIAHAVPVWGITFEAFPLEHSLRAPAVGYRITGDGARLFYAPDVVRIRRPSLALREVDVYIGDGATVSRPILRQRGSHLIGHASVAQQLRWCRRSGVRRAVFSHCGSQVVGADPREIEERISQMGLEQGVRASVAVDGLTIRLVGEVSA